MSGTGLCINPYKSIFYDKNRRIFLIATLSLCFNGIYAAINIFLGLSEISYWFITVGAYYLILAVMRFGIILSEKRNHSEENDSRLDFIRIFTGSLLIIMGIILCGVVYISIFYDVTKSRHEIFVITMATYAFTKITLAIINFVKRKHISSPVLSLIRNIGLADAAVSVFSLQRAMLVSFPGMKENEIMIMNACTGSAVWILVMLIGTGIIYTVKKENEVKIWQLQK